MRIQLTPNESSSSPAPMLVQYGPGDPPSGAENWVNKSDLVGAGYTRFDVICIGGAGGHGGRGTNSGSGAYHNGGGGGGGGIQRVQGSISDLPDLIDIIVGARGPTGTNGTSNGTSYTGWSGNPATYGGDGGYSSYGGVCKASGGKGGLVAFGGALYGSTVVVPGGPVEPNGGAGGLGGTTNPGHGAAGAVPNTDGTNMISYAADGFWTGSIGSGGGGGSGGRATGSTVNRVATAGGRGNYDSIDQSVCDPTAHPAHTDGSGGPLTYPGCGGGGKAAPLTFLGTIYGSNWDAYAGPTAPNTAGGFVAVLYT